MKYKLTRFLSFALLNLFLLQIGFAETPKDSIQDAIKSLTTANTQLRKSVAILNSTLQQQNQQIENLKKQDSIHSANIQETANSLGIKISNTETQSNQKITELISSISTRTLYWIIAFLGALLLSGITYLLLSKRQKSDKSEVIEQISSTKKSLEEEGVKLDTKLSEVLESQLKLLREERASAPVAVASSNGEPDHSLALKVADEITRINKNISNMEPATKGLKQLSASVERIRDNFAANGYDMPELLGKQFNEGMKVIVASSVPDENLKQGQEIISRIIKPQINYKGLMIQAAQVEVSIGQQ